MWKFGGLYLDLDYIILNDMASYKNFLVDNEKGQVTNNAFSFTPGHSFLNMLMMEMPKSYFKECWACIGPILFTKCLNKYQIQKNKTEDIITLPLQR